MAYLLFCIILITAFHFYFQNVVLPGEIAEKKDQLLKLDDRIEKLRLRNNISVGLYTGFKILFITSKSLLDSEEGFDVFMFTHRFDNNEPSSAKGVDASKIKNHEVKEIYTEWVGIMHKSAILNLYSWIIYFLPIILLAKIGFVSKKFTAQFNKWLSNVVSGSDLSTLIYSQ